VSPRVSPILRSSLEVMEHAIEHLMNKTDRDAKLAVLHADNAVELILKELVRVKRMRLIDRRGISIRYYDCIDKLLEKGISIPELPDIDLLHTERNSIYHLGTQPDQEKSEWLVYDVGLKFLRRVCESELKYKINSFSDLFKLTPEIKQEVAVTRSEMINKYLKDAMASLNSNLYEVSILSAFLGVETVLRETTSKETGMLLRSHFEIFNFLRDRKLVSNELFRDLYWLRNMRNQIAHGMYKATKKDAIVSLQTFQRVIKEMGISLNE